MYSMQRRMPASFRQSQRDSLSLEEVLEETAVDFDRIPPYHVMAPGVRPVWVKTLGEEVLCHVHVRLDRDPHAPLIIYHHGFSETPYYNSWARIFRPPFPAAAHLVLVQAPFHNHWYESFRESFASFQRVFQTFAGSLRLIDLVKREFEAQGAAFTMLSGVSWGGISTLLYAGMFGGVRAVAPMLSSPNLARVLWDGSQQFNVTMPLSQEELEEFFDFTSLCRCFDSNRVFPLLGADDQFFAPGRHTAVYDVEPVIVPRAHVAGVFSVAPLRRHILEVLDWAHEHPL
jgi:hypothetical protein